MLYTMYLIHLYYFLDTVWVMLSFFFLGSSIYAFSFLFPLCYLPSLLSFYLSIHRYAFPLVAHTTIPLVPRILHPAYTYPTPHEYTIYVHLHFPARKSRTVNCVRSWYLLCTVSSVAGCLQLLMLLASLYYVVHSFILGLLHFRLMISWMEGSRIRIGGRCEPTSVSRWCSWALKWHMCRWSSGGMGGGWWTVGNHVDFVPWIS